MAAPPAPSVSPTVAGVAYPSVYVRDLEAAAAFYAPLLGPVAYREEGIVGIRLGDTWLTLLDAGLAGLPAEGPRNAEFALRLAEAADVDEMFRRFVAAGAKPVMAPQEARMYEPMRYACVQDPQGLRLGFFRPRPSD